MRGFVFHVYQAEARKTAIYPNRGANLLYPVLGLNGEAGEVAEKTKKLLRDHNGILTEEFRMEMADELGDVLWYVSAICDELGLSMALVAKTNLAKLESRKDRNKLRGSGDNR